MYFWPNTLYPRSALRKILAVSAVRELKSQLLDRQFLQLNNKHRLLLNGCFNDLQQ